MFTFWHLYLYEPRIFVATNIIVGSVIALILMFRWRMKEEAK